MAELISRNQQSIPAGKMVCVRWISLCKIFIIRGLLQANNDSRLKRITSRLRVFECNSGEKEGAVAKPENSAIDHYFLV
jgi:hypothetical protein